MAGSLIVALESARSGLLVNQGNLNTVANNIANVNTPGYSRKIPSQETRVVVGEGAGVQLADIVRNVDAGLLRSLRLEKSTFNSLEAKDSFHLRIQELFGTPADNTSIAHIANQLTSAFELLAVSPEKTLEQGEVVRWGEEFANRLKDMSSTISELRRQADVLIAEHVTEINGIGASLDSLNSQIVRNSAIGLDVTDLKDQRDQDLDRLSELVDIQYFFRGNGDVAVLTSDGRTLIDSTPVTLAHDPASSMSATLTYAAGGIGGIYSGAKVAANDITGDIKGGKLKGLIEMRDEFLPNLQSQIDNLASEMREMVNRAHNRGIAFPGEQSTTGTRLFVRPTVQTMTLDPTSGADDVAIVLLDGNGDQQATTTLETIMTSASFGSAAQAANGPWTVSEVAATIEDWLLVNGASTATVAVGSDGKLAIDLNNTSLNLGFRDQTATAQGSTHADAVIGFDANGDGTIDETVSGFSYFFGLNDFFVDGLADAIYESDVMATTFTATAATVTFTDSTGSLGSVAITAGDTLDQMATAINSANIGVSASVIPDGTGSRLRFIHDGGNSMTVTQAAGNTLLTDLSMDIADVRLSTSLSVRSEIVTSPSKIASGALQWDSTRGTAGEYLSSISDNTIAEAIAESLTNDNAFSTAGGLTGISVSLSEYSSAILSRNSSIASVNKRNLEFHEVFSQSLQNKSDNVRGVNLDEELSQLVIYEQAYTAAARIISVIQGLFDTLNQILR